LTYLVRVNVPAMKKQLIEGGFIGIILLAIIHIQPNIKERYAQKIANHEYSQRPRLTPEQWLHC